MHLASIISRGSSILFLWPRLEAMLGCIVCSKQGNPSFETVDDDGMPRFPASKDGVRSLPAQVKDIAVKLAYRHCRPCTSASAIRQEEEGSCTGSLDIADAASEIAASNNLQYANFFSASHGFPVIGLGRQLSGPVRKDGHIRAAVNAVELGSPTDYYSKRLPSSPTTTHDIPVQDDDIPVQDVENEWVSQVEPGVLITFLALADGRNDLKRIRFSREMFSRWQAQQWWAENCEKVLELYNVSRLKTSTGPFPVPSRSKDKFKTSPERESRMVSPDDSPCEYCQNCPDGVCPSGILALKAYESTTVEGSSRSSPRDFGSLEHLSESLHGEHEETIHNTSRSSSSCQVRSTMSDIDPDRPDDLQSSGEGASLSTASEQEIEWVEEDDPGVYVTVRSALGGVRELKRVRFSREKFTEIEARMWWEENRIRIREQYL